MKTTIVFAHPWKNSLNQAICDTLTEKLQDDGDTVTLIDLYADGFDPVMSEQDLKAYSQGETLDPMIVGYNEILDQTEKIVFVFPIWWYDMPAMLRGFFDKVMLEGSAYTADEHGMHPVRQIEHTFLFTTSSVTTEALIHDFGDPVHGTIIDATFKALGFKNAKWHNLGNITEVGEKEATAYLASLKDRI